MTELHSIVSQEQVEIERAFAGAVFYNPKGAREQAGWLDPDSIMNPQIREYWKRVKEGEEPVTASYAVGWTHEPFGWGNGVMSTRPGQYADALMKKKYMREAILGAEQIVKAAQEDNEDVIQAIASQMVTKSGGRDSSMRTPLEIGASLKKRIRKGNLSVPWGIESFDEATRGSERGTLTVLAGRPSMGKSSLAFQANEYQALRLDQKVGVWAIEMSAEQMFARRTCYRIGRSWMDVRAGLLSDAEQDELDGYVDEYSASLEGQMWVNDSTETTVAQIVRTQLQQNFDVLMIDHLGLLKDPQHGRERHDQYLGRLTETLHNLAKNTNAVIILLAQLNRSVEQRADKRPHMGDLRDSGAIEQNADNVALLFGEWYYDRDAANITEIIFGKFRDGVMNSSAYVEFLMREQRFVSVSQEAIDVMSEDNMQDAHEKKPPTHQHEEMPF